MKVIPAKRDLRLTGSDFTSFCFTFTAETERLEKRKRKPIVAYARAGPAPYRRPPRAGPTIKAVCADEVDHATARGKELDSTRPGNNACDVGPSNARAAPRMSTIARIDSVPSRPEWLPAASARAPMPSTNCAARRIDLRSYLSAA